MAAAGVSVERYADLIHVRIGGEHGLRIEVGNDSRPELPLFGIFGFPRSFGVKVGRWFAGLAWGKP